MMYYVTKSSHCSDTIVVKRTPGMYYYGTEEDICSCMFLFLKRILPMISSC